VKHRSRLVVLAAFAAAASYTVPGAAQPRAKDEPSSAHGEEKLPEGDKDPLRGSTFIFDQSATTQTLGLDRGQQSYVPDYRWWMSLRPRWNFSDRFRVQARLDFYKELTNSQDTTYYREDTFGDIWTDAIYSTPLAETGPWKNTKVSVGARAIWPTSKQTQGQGVYVTLGGQAGISQKIPLRGEDAPFLDFARVGLSFTYLHAFSNSTTPDNYGNFAYTRQNVDGFSFISHQLTGQTLSEHTLYAIVDTGLQITPKLGFTLDWILINQWHYQPTAFCASGLAAPPPGSPCPAPNNTQPDNQFTQLGWFLTSLDYEIIPELSVGLGYYNLANTVGPNGQANSLFGGGENNFLWSPDARVFFDVTANLDKIFEDASGRYKAKPGQTAEAARSTRASGLASGLR
jgi:hypothetical protein